MRDRQSGNTDRGNIRLEGLTKRFKRLGGAQVNAIDQLDLYIPSGQFTVLVGPSGCGKTTLLRCLAGLERPDEGVIKLGQDVAYSSVKRVDIAPERRNISMLFQSYALWPHMTVFDNVAYPLRSGGASKEEINKKVVGILEKVQCQNLVSQYPNQISGGQQQRVALARALVAGREIVLFDEPLSNIDARVRDQLRLEILKIQRDLGFTAVYVTHDQTEALTLANQIVVLRDGTIAQAGTPLEVYNTPTSAYVARFMGILNEVTLTRTEPGPEGRITYITSIGRIAAPRRDNVRGGDTLICFRPIGCGLYLKKPAAENNLFEGHVVATLFLGSHFEYVVRVGDQDLRVWLTDPLGEAIDGRVWLHIPEASIMILD